MTKEELLAKKRHVLIKFEDSKNPGSVVVVPNRVSPCGKYIELGGYYSDEFRGWVDVEDLAASVCAVIQEFDPEPEPKSERGFFAWLLGKA